MRGGGAVVGGVGCGVRGGGVMDEEQFSKLMERLNLIRDDIIDFMKLFFFAAWIMGALVIIF